MSEALAQELAVRRIVQPPRCATWMRKRVSVAPRVSKPAPQPRAGATAERLSGRQLALAWCLADDRDAIADRSRHDRPRALQVSRVDAFRARSDASVKSDEGACAID